MRRASDGLEFPSLADSTFLESLLLNQYNLGIRTILGFHYQNHFTFNGTTGTASLLSTWDFCPSIPNVYYYLTSWVGLVYTNITGTVINTWTIQYVGLPANNNMGFQLFSFNNTGANSNHSNLFVKQLTLNSGSGLTAGNYEVGIVGYRILAV